jgi:hypothetical protein
MLDKSDKTVFISYAHEDAIDAERLSRDLKNVGVITWRDKDSIRAGENWKLAISKAIKNSRYFIPLFSSKSVGKIGYVHKEFKYAIDVLENYPPSEIFIIPVRLDNCEIPYERLESIHYADLFPDWNKGIKQILDSMEIDIKKQEKEIQEKEGEEEQWRKGISEKDWKDLLTFICKKKCIPFIGSGTYTAQSKDGKTFIPLSKDIIDKWKEKHRYPLEDLYELARIYTLEDSYQLARLAEFLEIENADEDEMYPKTMLSEMLKEINSSNFNSESKLPYDVLANLNLPIYMTTNYDRFLEEALSRNGSKEPKSDFCKWSDKLMQYVKMTNISSVFDEKDYKPDEKFPLVYHIHGDINIPESMVLTERDYFEFVINLNKSDDKDILPSIIRKELATSSLLFIGYTLEDINFRAIFQGFLSFMSSIDKKYRKLSIAVQIPPIISKKEQAKMQKYLEQYTRHMFDIHIFWGETFEFITELERHWKEFKAKNDMKTCLPIKEV